MKRLFSLALVCALTLVASCATTPPQGPSTGSGPPAITGQRTLLDDKALFAVEAAYNVAAQAYVAADARDQLSAEVKAVVRPQLTRAYAALLAARTAHAAGEAETFTAQAAAVVSLAGQAQRLLPAN